MRTPRLPLTALTAICVGQLGLVASGSPPPWPPVPEVAMSTHRTVTHSKPDHLLHVGSSPDHVFPVPGEPHAVPLRTEVRQRVRLLAQAAPVEEEVRIEHAEPSDSAHVALRGEGMGIGWAGRPGWIGENILLGAEASGPLVIPEGESDAADLAELKEDLTILARLLNKAAGRSGERGETMAMGIALSALPGVQRSRPIYLEGFGALFALQVPFPLAPEAETKDQGEERPKNSAWEEARREIYGQPRVPAALWLERKEIGKPSYNADRVEQLKRELTEALKNASNLRQMKDEDTIVVAVTGASPLPGEMRVVRLESRESKTGREDRKGVVTSRQEIRESGAATLVLRVKKADADAYAAGKLERDEFAKKVTVNTY